MLLAHGVLGYRDRDSGGGGRGGRDSCVYFPRNSGDHGSNFQFSFSPLFVFAGVVFKTFSSPTVPADNIGNPLPTGDIFSFLPVPYDPNRGGYATPPPPPSPQPGIFSLCDCLVEK